MCFSSLRVDVYCKAAVSGGEVKAKAKAKQDRAGRDNKDVECRYCLNEVHILAGEMSKCAWPGALSKVVKSGLGACIPALRPMITTALSRITRQPGRVDST